MLVTDNKGGYPGIKIIGEDGVMATMVFPTKELHELNPRKMKFGDDYPPVRSPFEELTKEIYPEYDIEKPTVQYPSRITTILQDS